jgi:hypothetical protein
VKKTTELVAAVLAAVLTVGLAVPVTSIQEAQANPCANEISRGGSADNAFIPQDDDERECDFTGYFDFEEEDDSEDMPPTPPTGAIIIITGQGSGTFSCQGVPQENAIIRIFAQEDEDGTLGAAVQFDNVDIGGGDSVQILVNDATTDGNTFSLSGPQGVCGFFGDSAPFTVSGNCGTGVTVSYAEPPVGTGTFTADVECTPL